MQTVLAPESSLLAIKHSIHSALLLGLYPWIPAWRYRQQVLEALGPAAVGIQGHQRRAQEPDDSLLGYWPFAQLLESCGC